MKTALILLVRLYQRTFSPDHSKFGKALFPGGFCKYTPSCSEYAIGAVKKRGVTVGLCKSFWRLLRCNPFSKGGLDLP